MRSNGPLANDRERPKAIHVGEAIDSVLFLTSRLQHSMAFEEVSKVHCAKYVDQKGWSEKPSVAFQLVWTVVPQPVSTAGGSKN